MILSSGQALLSLVGLISGAILTRVFTKEDFGSYRQAMLACTFAFPFVTLGFDRSLYTFLPGETARLRGRVVETLLLLAFGAAVLAGFILLGGSRLLTKRFNNPAIASLLPLLAPYVLFTIPASALGACLLARERTRQLAVFNVASRLGLLACVLAPILWRPDPKAALIGQSFGAVISGTVALILMFRACNQGDWRPTLAGLREQIGFAVPLGLAGLAGALSLSLDQVIVANRCTPEQFAVYSVGAFEIPLIGIITGSITAVCLVEYARMFRENRAKDVVELMHRATTRSALLLLPAMIFLFCEAPALMTLLFRKAYTESSTPFRIYLLLLPIRTITFGAILQAAGQSRLVLAQSILGLLANAVLGWILVGFFGPNGAAAASVAATWLISVPFLIWAIQRTVKTSWRALFPWPALGRIFLASLLPAVPVLVLTSFLPAAPAIQLAVGAAVYAVAALILFRQFRLVTRQDAPTFLSTVPFGGRVLRFLG